MENIQIESIGFPFREPGVGRLGVSVLVRATAMGLLGREQTISELEWESYRALIGEMVRGGGVARALLAEAKSLTASAPPEEFRVLLEQIAEALEASPIPSKEWLSLLEVFTHKQLASLLGTSASSVRRYADGVRPTPQEVAERLHFIALVVGDLAGTYNPYGVRRWFKRRRKLLSGKAPAELLEGAWAPDEREPSKVRELAHALMSHGAT